MTVEKMWRKTIIENVMPIVIYNYDTCKLIVVSKLYNTRTKTLMQYKG